MNERTIQIECEGETLLGILHSAAPRRDGVPPKRAVLILVGGAQYRVGSHRQFLLLARHLAGRGLPVLRFDFRGMGDSTGMSPGFDGAEADTRTAIDVLFREQPDLTSVCIFGLCDAASAALLYCATDSRVDSLVLANPWVRTNAGQAAAVVKHYYRQRMFQKSFWTKLLSGGLSPFSGLSGLFKSLHASRGKYSQSLPYIDRMLDGLRRFQGPILLLSSGQDLTAREFDDLCAAHAVWSAAIKMPLIHRIDLPEADHTFSTRASLEAANAAIADFLDGAAERIYV